MGFSIILPNLGRDGCLTASPDCKMDMMLLPCLLRVPTRKSFLALVGAICILLPVAARQRVLQEKGGITHPS